jgi:hypothetical protein
MLRRRICEITDASSRLCLHLHLCVHSGCCLHVKLCGMKSDVLCDEGLDKEVAVVVSFLQSQGNLSMRKGDNRDTEGEDTHGTDTNTRR